MSTSNDQRYSRLFHLRRLSLPEEVINIILWISAVIAVVFFNADGYFAGSAAVAWVTILINTLLPFTSHWKRLVLKRPGRLLKTDRKLLIAIYCILYLILLIFTARRIMILLAPWV